MVFFKKREETLKQILQGRRCSSFNELEETSPKLSLKVPKMPNSNYPFRSLLYEESAPQPKSEQSNRFACPDAFEICQSSDLKVDLVLLVCVLC